MSEDKVKVDGDNDVPSWLVGTGLETDLSGERKSNTRFWLKRGTSRKIIFLTDSHESPVVWEHQFPIDGNWNNHATCLQTMGKDCPLCALMKINEKISRYKAAFFTIIDTTEWTDAGGATHSNDKKLFVAKSSTAEKLRRRVDRLEASGKSLLYSMFEVFRGSSQKAPAVGEDFEYIKTLEEAAIADKEEFDYLKLLRPNEEEMALFVNKLRGETGGGSVPLGGEGTTERVKY